MIEVDATIVFEKNWQAKDNFRYIINSGSSRSSKTHSLIQLIYLYALQNSNKKISVFRDTKQICKQTVFEDMKKIYPGMPMFKTVELNLTESIFKFKSGSAIHIEGTDDYIKIHGYHSDVLWFNESNSISKETFDQLDMRCTGFVLFDYNPTRKHFIEDIIKMSNSILINSTWRDNPFIPEKEKIKILSYQSIKKSSVVEDGFLSESDAREYDVIKNELGFSYFKINELSRCRENEYTRTANDFNHDVYDKGIKADRPHRIHFFEEVSLDQYLSLDVPVYYYSDWGSVHAWAIGECKWYDGGLYIRELNYDSENEIRAKLSATDLSLIRAQDEGIVSWMFAKLGIDQSATIICDTNRPMKILALRESGWEYAVGISRKDSGASKGFNVDGIDLVNNINVFYTSDSENIKDEQENYSRKVDRSGEVLEEPEDFKDHHMNGIKYMATWLQAEGVIKKV